MAKRKLSARKTGVITALVIGIVGVLLFGGLAFAYFPDVFSGGTDGNNFASVAVTVFFEDGTLKTFESSTPYDGTLSMPPMSVYVGGQAITGIRAECKVTLNDAPAIQSWQSNVRQRMEIYEGGKPAPITSSTVDFPNSGSSWTSGSTRTIASLDVPVGQLESIIASKGGDGAYSIQVVNEVTLTVIDTNSKQTTLTGSAVGGITMTYVDNTAMSITVNTNISGLR